MYYWTRLERDACTEYFPRYRLTLFHYFSTRLHPNTILQISNVLRLAWSSNFLHNMVRVQWSCLYPGANVLIISVALQAYSRSESPNLHSSETWRQMFPAYLLHREELSTYSRIECTQLADRGGGGKYGFSKSSLDRAATHSRQIRGCESYTQTYIPFCRCNSQQKRVRSDWSILRKRSGRLLDGTWVST